MGRRRAVCPRLFVQLPVVATEVVYVASRALRRATQRTRKTPRNFTDTPLHTYYERRIYLFKRI